MTATLRMPGGVVLRQGEHYDFPEFHPVQQLVVPVLSTVNPDTSEARYVFRVAGKQLYGMGTAVGVGAGWFLTAKHVLQPFVEGLAADETEQMVIVLESKDVATSDSDHIPTLSVRAWDLHTDCDLAAVTAELDADVVGDVRKTDMSIRMPIVGEPLVAVGYPAMATTGSLPKAGSATLGWDRTLRASVGSVVEQVPGRTGGWYHAGPGVLTDIPAFPGMSGGPVFDQDMSIVGFVSMSSPPGEHGSDWSTFVQLLAPVLELGVLDLPVGTNVDVGTAPALNLAVALAAGSIECQIEEDWDVDPVKRKVIYLPAGE